MGLNQKKTGVKNSEILPFKLVYMLANGILKLFYYSNYCKSREKHFVRLGTEEKKNSKDRYQGVNYLFLYTVCFMFWTSMMYSIRSVCTYALVLCCIVSQRSNVNGTVQYNS